MIELHRLKLEDFMCISKADLDFTNEKIILLIGNNGHGKSAVMDAISMCLNETKRADSYKEYVRKGQKQSLIKLDASIKGNPISFEITIWAKGGTEKTVTYDKKTYKNSEVADLLSTFDLKYFSEIIMSMQGEGDITKLSPAQREQFLQKLLNFDFAEQLVNCKTNLAETRATIDFNTSQISFTEEAISSKKQEHREPLPITLTDTEVGEIRSAISDISAKIAKLPTLINSQNILQKEKDLLINTAHAKTLKITNLENKIARVNDDLKELQSVEKQISEENTKLENNEKLFRDNDALVADLLLKVNAKKVEAVDLETELRKKNNVVYNLQHKVEVIKDGKCGECGSTFTSDTIEQVTAECDKETLECSVLTSKLGILNSELSNLNTEMSNLQANKVKLNTEKAVITTNKSNLEKKLAQLQSTTTTLSALQKDLETEKQTSDCDSSKVKEIETQLADLQTKIQTFDGLNKNLQLNQTKLNAYNDTVAQNNIILQTNENIQKAVVDMELKITETKAAIEKSRAQETIHNDVIVLLEKTFPNYLIVKTCAKLEAEMNNYIQNVFPNMEVRLFQNKKGVEFFYTPHRDKIKDFKKENLLNVKMASGFEKSVLSMAFKVSLCKAYNLPFAFLDEIDSAGSEENSQRLFESLISNDTFDQLFIISHKNSVRDIIKSLAPKVKTYYVNKGKFSIDE